MNPSKWLLFSFAIVGALLSSCTSSTPVVNQTSVMIPTETKTATATLTPLPETLPPATLSTSASGTSQVLLIDGWSQDDFPTDAAKITAVTIESYILTIQVVYQGGCQEHTFVLFAETPFLLSNPPQWTLYLSHDAHGDTCTGNMEKQLSFDLSPMDKDRTERRAHPLLLRMIEPVGDSFATAPVMPLVEWP